MIKILIIDDDVELCELLRDALRYAKYEAEFKTDASAGIARLNEERFDLILLDIRLGEADGMEVLKRILAKEPQQRVIMITSHGTIPLAVQALKNGAYNFVQKPIDLEGLLQLLKQAEQESTPTRPLTAPSSRGKLAAHSEAMQAIVKRLPGLAQSDATILLLGESGTGKELVATTIHQLSRRAAKQFVAINCAALPENLAGSELFGHERGAFTGAIATKKGKLEIGNGGTVLLDEIGDMPLLTQSHLLRFLENKTFERVGGVKLIEANVRIISATNRDLAAAIVEGKFREDLFYRLKVASLVLPPLRDRREDLAELTEYFLQAVSAKSNQNPPTLTDAAWQLLQEYDFPGNVRELQHILQSATISAVNKELLTEDDFVPLLHSDSDQVSSSSPSAIALKKAVGEFKREHIQKILAEHNGNKTHAAKALGISRVHLIKLAKELGVE